MSLKFGREPVLEDEFEIMLHMFDEGDVIPIYISGISKAVVVNIIIPKPEKRARPVKKLYANRVFIGTRSKIESRRDKFEDEELIYIQEISDSNSVEECTVEGEKNGNGDSRKEQGDAHASNEDVGETSNINGEGYSGNEKGGTNGGVNVGTDFSWVRPVTERTAINATINMVARGLVDEDSGPSVNESVEHRSEEHLDYGSADDEESDEENNEESDEEIEKNTDDPPKGIPDDFFPHTFHYSAEEDQNGDEEDQSGDEDDQNEYISEDDDDDADEEDECTHDRRARGDEEFQQAEVEAAVFWKINDDSDKVIREDIPIYDGKDGYKDCSLEVGKRYKNASVYRLVLMGYAAQRKIEYLFLRNESKRISIVCLAKNCRFKDYASKSRTGDYFAIRYMFPDHDCPTLRTNRSVKSTYLAARFLPYIRRYPTVTRKELVAKIDNELHIAVTGSQAYSHTSGSKIDTWRT